MIISSDGYQQYHKQKALRPFLSGTNRNLELKQVITGEEPDIATFEVPAKYDLLKYPNQLHLVVDPQDEDRSSGKGGEFQDCSRATNGNCLLEWNTTFDPPGQHHLRANLYCFGTTKENGLFIDGPILPFYSSNTVQFDPFYSDYDDRGAILYGKVAKTNVTYSIELKTPDGIHIRTITGGTSNGIIEEHWDLTDDHGNKVTNASFNADFHVMLPGESTNSVSKTHAEKTR
jgi:hypothetical protein